MGETRRVFLFKFRLTLMKAMKSTCQELNQQYSKLLVALLHTQFHVIQDVVPTESFGDIISNKNANIHSREIDAFPLTTAKQ